MAKNTTSILKVCKDPVFAFRGSPVNQFSLRQAKKLVGRNKTAMLHLLKELVLRNASNSIVFILCQCFRKNRQP